VQNNYQQKNNFTLTEIKQQKVYQGHITSVSVMQTISL